MGTTHRMGFVIEQALGHVTHATNVKAVVETDSSIDPAWCLIPWETSGLSARVPVFNSNWTVRAGLRARRAIRAAHHEAPLDALFVHTQVPGVLAADWLKKIPSVVSIDATPIQYDAMGAHYEHSQGNSRIERLKYRANRRCFDAATVIVSWSAWAKQSLVDDYGVDQSKVVVIPPGVPYDRWKRSDEERTDDGIVRILFVGGDLVRKGGLVLLEAFERVRQDVAADCEVELHMVTRLPAPVAPAVFYHDGLTANAPELISLFHRCDIFCLPTRADTFALVVCEAGAAGLPVVATSVGAISEIVVDGESGFLIPPDDVDALADSLTTLVRDPAMRRRFGAAGASIIKARFDAKNNALRIVDALRSIAN